MDGVGFRFAPAHAADFCVKPQKHIDVDDFKAVNDKYGHNAGDEVIREVARVLKRTLRKKDMVIRAGGDEFLVLLAGDIFPDDVETVVSKINEALARPFSID